MTAARLAIIIDSSMAFGNFLAQIIGALVDDVVILKTLEDALNSPLLAQTSLLITDALLPDGNGFEIAAVVRGLRPTIPIAVMSFDPELEPFCRTRGLVFILKSAMAETSWLSQLQMALPQN